MIDTEEWKKVNKNGKSELANFENDLENKLEPVPARGLETEMASICQEGKKKSYSGILFLFASVGTSYACPRHIVE